MPTNTVTAKLHEYFKRFDIDNSNTLDKREFKNLIRICFPEKNCKDLEINQIFKNLDVDSDGCISFNEFKELGNEEYNFFQNNNNQNSRRQYQQDNNGDKMFDEPNIALLHQYFKNFDTDNNNELDKDEFTNLVKTCFPEKG